MANIIRRIKIAASEITTVKSDDPYLLHPFQAYVVTDNSVCGHISHFTSGAAAYIPTPAVQPAPTNGG